MHIKDTDIQQMVSVLNDEPEIPEITDIRGSSTGLFLHRSSTKVISDYYSTPCAAVPSFSAKGTPAKDA